MSCRVIVIVIMVVITAVIAEENNPKVQQKKKPGSYQYTKTKIGENEYQTFHAGNGGAGISSIAGIASRNGRVSSISGIDFFPGIQAPVVATSLSTADLGRSSNNRYPVSAKIIKSEDGKYASSSINISPGSVSVSSIARSAPLGSGDTNSVKTFSSAINTLKTPMQPLIKPFGNSPFLQNPFDTRNLNPWIPNYMFRTPYPVRTGYQQPPSFANPIWQYPSFPFMNYWQ